MHEIKLGSHVSMNGREMFLGSVKEAISYGASTFMIYTGAPQNTRRKPIDELRIEEGSALMTEHGISDFVVHAPYIINLANTVKPETYEIAVKFLALEIERTSAMGAKQLVLHPGAHVGAGVDAGIESIIKGLNEVLDADQHDEVKIALETMAGKGTELGRSFEELARIIDGIHKKERISICFDTCHVNDAGYNIRDDFDGVIKQFDQIIGLERIGVFHVNDSKNPMGAKKDRHENFGFGSIGYEALRSIIYDARFADIPKILETPYVMDEESKKKTYPPYKHEIAMIKGGTFDESLKEKIVWDGKQK